MPQPAYVEEVDDNDEPVHRTRRSAEKKVEIKNEKHNSERRLVSRKEKEKGSSDSRRAHANSSPPPLKRVETKLSSKEERRKSSSHTASPKKVSTRPPSVHNNATYPQIELPLRPIQQPVFIQRAITHPHPRPQSFHEGMSYHAYGPPLSNSAYYVAPNNSLMPAPSYPPPSPLGGYMQLANGAAYHPDSGGSLPPPFRQDYSAPAPQLPTRTLEERLGGTTRRRSIQYGAADLEDRGYDSAYERSLPVVRKPSLRKTKAQLDAERMPPPPPRRRSSVRYADEVFDDELYEPRSRPVYEDERPSSRQRRPSMSRYPASYAYGSGNEARIEPERSVDRSRRNSYYGAPSYSVYNVPAPAAPDNYEDKFQAAESYQNSVGGPQVRLTAETLKKASRRPKPASSHSTRSSGSHDESVQRSSVTTRTTGTTRTGAGEEDITIRLKGQGKIKIAGAEIDYDKDTELNIRRGNGGGGGGSQRSSEYGSEDRRDRAERASDRSRISSNARHSGERRYSRA